MSKAKIIDKKSVDSILGEKNLLSQLHHSFIVNMIYSFQDHDFLYLVMDLLPGGNLRYHLCLKRRFNERQNKFLIGCILVGLEYIHSQCILHRDIKPENLVFDSNGYLRITDFGIAKKYIVNNKKDTSGTVGYLAPEILCNQNHTYSIDYYAVGIIAYELAYGRRPYIGKSKHEVKQLILTTQAHIDYDELPSGYQDEAADFINHLIQRKPKYRLGQNGISEVINHPWLRGFDWDGLKEKNLKAFYIPKEGDNFDKKYCLQNNKLGTETLERYKEIALETNYSFIFKKFDCDKVPDELKYIEPKIIYGENTNNNNGNNVYNSSNISSTSISRNNKINGNNDNKKDIKNNYGISSERNKSMENILMNRNQIFHLNNKSKMMIDREISHYEYKNLKEEENNINKINELKYDNEKRRESLIISNKKNDNKLIFNKKNNNSFIDKKNIIRLIDERGNTNNKKENVNNSLGNINYYYQKNQNINPNILIKNKDKSAIYENMFELSGLEKKDIKEKESLLFNQKFTNLNQYIMNNYNKKRINKAKMMNNSNSSLNFFPNDRNNNIKSNYFKKILKNKILSKDMVKLKDKSNSNSLIASNSTQSLFKKDPDLSSSYIKPNKKQLLKKEILHGTFYQAKPSSTKYFFFQKKSSSSLNKKSQHTNKRLSSSSSMSNFKNLNNDINNNNISDVCKGMDDNFYSKISKDLIKNNEKNLPFINFTITKKNLQNFRNNSSFGNRNNSKIFLNSNVFFSERIKEYEIKKIKGPNN